MATTNTFQERVLQLDHRTLTSMILHDPQFTNMGKAQGAYTPKAYENATCEILKISINPTQLDTPSSLMDTVFPRGGITTGIPDTISSYPRILEYVESDFRERNIQEVFPQILTEMNEKWDEITIKELKAKAKARTEFTWTCQSAFIAEVISALGEHKRQTRKHIILGPNLYTALMVTAHHLEMGVSWYPIFKERLASYNCTLRVGDMMRVALKYSSTDKKAAYFIIEEPFLAEYAGIIPKYLISERDTRKHESFIHFIFSNTSINLRTELAVEFGAVKDLDMTKLGEASCTKKP